jgi:hypothetical protein
MRNLSRLFIELFSRTDLKFVSCFRSIKLTKCFTSTGSLRSKILNIINFALNNNPESAVFVVVLQIGLPNIGHVLGVLGMGLGRILVST